MSWGELRWVEGCGVELRRVERSWYVWITHISRYCYSKQSTKVKELSWVGYFTQFQLPPHLSSPLHSSTQLKACHLECKNWLLIGAITSWAELSLFSNVSQNLTFYMLIQTFQRRRKHFIGGYSEMKKTFLLVSINKHAKDDQCFECSISVKIKHFN